MGVEPLPGVANYLLGGRSGSWIGGVRRYAKVRYKQVYPGIDVVYYCSERQLEHDFVIAPGSDPRRIRMSLQGAGELRLDGGDLLMESSGRTFRQKRPVIYQEIRGQRKTVAGSYVLKSGLEFGFQLGDYDRSKRWSSTR
jgi:hypothetical protein